MSKRDQTEKKAERAESSSEQLSEEQLEKTAGGVRWRMTDVLITS